MKQIFLIIISTFIFSCQEKAEYVQGDWVTGTEQEKMVKIERHFRGFDMTMVETGYRYQELYWAGMDANWPYAEYQLQKIELTLSDGLERRPLRTPSAKLFINVAVPEMKSSINEKETATFRRAFQVFTKHCNACHAMENVPHFNVKIPKINLSPISLENY
ncbi:MAG: hypothetical protein H0X63_07680 [Flavobacteriales bacterium]|nr:hypothetical protein [Flavobacteriales bacterium]